MGYAVAEAARRLGAEVTLVTGPTALEASAGVQVVPVLSAEDMLKEVQNRYKDLDIVIKAAAVADYRPLVQSKSKMKKADKTLTLELVKNPDILETLGKNKTHQFLVGFAAETDSLDEYAMDKLVRKNCDLLVGNDVSVEGAGFGSETNVVRIYDKQGLVESLPLLRKEEVALHLLRLIAARMDEKEGEV